MIWLTGIQAAVGERENNQWCVVTEERRLDRDNERANKAEG